MPADISIKQQFVEAMRLTPDGVREFLNKPIPTPPTVATPADVDAAIIANGVAAKYILDLFAPFAGWTPIETILRVGQHSNVAEVIALAALEYIGESNAQGDLVIDYPQAGETYTPGNVRLQCHARNGNLQQVGVDVGEDHAPVSLEPDDHAIFGGVIRLADAGDYTATFSALFQGKDTPVTATVSFSLAAEGQDPEGDDLSGLQAAQENYHDAADKFANLVITPIAVGNALLDGATGVVATAENVVKKTMSAVITGMDNVNQSAAKLGDAIMGFKANVKKYLDDRAAIESGRGLTRDADPVIALTDNLLLQIGDLTNAVDDYAAIVIADWEREHPHPASGYAYSPEALGGAIGYANAKYGLGSVTVPW